MLPGDLPGLLAGDLCACSNLSAICVGVSSGMATGGDIRDWRDCLWSSSSIPMFISIILSLSAMALILILRLSNTALVSGPRAL